MCSPLRPLTVGGTAGSPTHCCAPDPPGLPRPEPAAPPIVPLPPAAPLGAVRHALAYMRCAALTLRRAHLDFYAADIERTMLDHAEAFGFDAPHGDRPA